MPQDSFPKDKSQDMCAQTSAFYWEHVVSCDSGIISPPLKLYCILHSPTVWYLTQQVPQVRRNIPKNELGTMRQLASPSDVPFPPRRINTLLCWLAARIIVTFELLRTFTQPDIQHHRSSVDSTPSSSNQASRACLSRHELSLISSERIHHPESTLERIHHPEITDLRQVADWSSRDRRTETLHLSYDCQVNRTGMRPSVDAWFLCMHLALQGLLFIFANDLELQLALPLTIVLWIAYPYVQELIKRIHAFIASLPQSRVNQIPTDRQRVCQPSMEDHEAKFPQAETAVPAWAAAQQQRQILQHGESPRKPNNQSRRACPFCCSIVSYCHRSRMYHHYIDCYVHPQVIICCGTWSSRPFAVVMHLQLRHYTIASMTSCGLSTCEGSSSPFTFHNKGYPSLTYEYLMCR